MQVAPSLDVVHLAREQTTAQGGKFGASHTRKKARQDMVQDGTAADAILSGVINQGLDYLCSSQRLQQ